jgi:hypothetical protein
MPAELVDHIYSSSNLPLVTLGVDRDCVERFVSGLSPYCSSFLKPFGKILSHKPMADGSQLVLIALAVMVIAKSMLCDRDAT